MNIATYLNRIKYQNEIKINLATLVELQKAHLQTVPFENLDIHYGNKIILDIESIYTKIITHKRGGFCYELNGLFYYLLKNIGFDVKMISARVYFQKTKKYGEEYDHLAIIAKLNAKNYLLDVGFGKFALKPLLIALEIPQKDDLGLFQFDEYADNYLRISEIMAGESVPQYIFKTEAREFHEFLKMCDFHQTSDLSHFTKQKVISILSQNGRITLNDEKLKINKEGIIEELTFKTESEFEDLLKQYFDIEIKH